MTPLSADGWLTVAVKLELELELELGAGVRATTVTATESAVDTRAVLLSRTSRSHIGGSWLPRGVRWTTRPYREVMLYCFISLNLISYTAAAAPSGLCFESEKVPFMSPVTMTDCRPAANAASICSCCSASYNWKLPRLFCHDHRYAGGFTSGRPAGAAVAALRRARSIACVASGRKSNSSMVVSAEVDRVEHHSRTALTSSLAHVSNGHRKMPLPTSAMAIDEYPCWSTRLNAVVMALR